MTHAPLRLAIDIGPLHGHRTGVGVAVDGLVKALRQRTDIEVVPYLVSFRSEAARGQRRLPIPGIVASHLWSRVDRPRADRWLAGADLVHGTNYVAPPSELPTIVSVYDCWFLEHPELATPLVRRAGRTLQRAVDRGAWVHTSSDATAAAARRLLGTDRVATVLLGAPAAAPPPDDVPRPAAADDLAGRPFVLSVATEERRKDLTRLVAAFEIVAASDGDARLVMAGARGNQSGDIDAALAALPDAVRARVHRLGPIDDVTKGWLLRQASVLAYPSLDEGFGFPILEAQAAGTPVVASRVGAIPEVAGEGAVLVGDAGPAELAAAVLGVLGGGATRLGLIEAGHRNARRFSWDTTADELVELYRRVAEAGS